MLENNNISALKPWEINASPISSLPGKLKMNPNLAYTPGSSPGMSMATGVGLASSVFGSASGIFNEFQNLNNFNPLQTVDTNASSKGDLNNRINNFSAMGGYEGDLGRTSGVGTGLSMGAKGAQGGAAIGSLLGPIGGAVGGAIGGIGGFLGGLFGSNRANREKAKIEKYNEQKTLGEFQGQNALMNQNNIRGWQSNQLAYGGILPMTNNVNNLLAMKGNNLFAYGGEFSNGVNLVDTGDTHEKNPLGGVPIGIGENGMPNLVEENEVIWNNYVFSDRLNIKGAEDVFLNKNLNKKSYAKAALKISEESKERPNDIISKRGLQDGLGKLAMLQEEAKAKKGDVENVGNEFASGGKLKSSMSDALRYSPLISNLGILGDIYTKSPDRMKMSRIAPQVLSDRMNYNPVDSEYLANKISQQGAGTKRALIDASGGNRSIAMSGLLASENSINSALGDSLMQAREFNTNERNRALDFNRNTGMFNAQQDLRAQEYNANAFNKEEEWRLQAEANRRNMIRQGIGIMGTTLGDIGTENRWMEIAPIISGGYSSKGRYNNKKEDGGLMTYYKNRIK